MRQFWDTYGDDKKVAPLVRQLPWSHNLIILGQSKRPDAFYDIALITATEAEEAVAIAENYLRHVANDYRLASHVRR